MYAKDKTLSVKTHFSGYGKPKNLSRQIKLAPSALPLVQSQKAFPLNRAEDVIDNYEKKTLLLSNLTAFALPVSSALAVGLYETINKIKKEEKN